MLLVSLSAGVQAQEQSPVPKTKEEPATGEITGKVVNESGQPLAGAAVIVRGANNRLSGRSTTSDIEGNFRVNGLEPGLYAVGANAPAYSGGGDPNLNTTFYRIGDTVRLEMVRGGAITGTVTNAFGEPVIGVRVRATMVRDAKGEVPKTPTFSFLEQATDDRGIYRIYGLAPGGYLVSAGGSGFSPTFNPYESDVPTYAPSSSTRDNAAEVSVKGGEDSNADIRYRGEPGHSIGGSVKTAGTTGAQVMLTPAGASLPTGTVFQFPGSRGFVFNGLSDGEYDVVGQELVSAASSATPLLALSEVKRITIKGANVSGIELVPRPLASLSGRISLESSKAPECQGKRPPLLAETLLETHRPEKEAEQDSPYLRMFPSSGSPDLRGSFSLFNLKPGKYQFDLRFYARYWYLDSITLGAPATALPKSQTAPSRTDVAANWTILKVGEQLNNLTIKLAEGASSIRGRLPLAEGAAMPTGMAIYLLPVEPERAEDVLRFFVAAVAADGTFALNNLPPGKYRMLAQTSDPQTATILKLREPEAAASRAKLRKTAETKKTEIELKPCQNVADYQPK